jgi:HK97 family phage major capsid protein
MAFTSAGFPAEMVKEVFIGAKGHSSIAKLCDQTPVAFSGTDIMSFSFDGEINLVGEAAAKAEHSNSNAPINIVPKKIEYGARVSDEFVRCSEEKRLEYLKGFNEGFEKKIARGIDIMAMHGTNPKTGALATLLIGKNSFDTNDDVTSVTYDASDLEGNLNSAVAAIGDYENTGMAFSKTFAAGLASIKENGVSQYPQFKLGANPGAMNGVPCDVNSTVSKVAGEYAYVGDFKNAFKWGYADKINFEVIEYGDPDNSGNDLKGHNQVYLRAEAWVGWAILDGAAFARIEKTGSGS